MRPQEHEVEPVKILLVDDRPSNLSTLEAILRRPDYDLVSARSGREALGLLLRHEFAVILLDVAMPEMDGFETAAVIKSRDQSRLIPIIFVTASVTDLANVFRGYTVGAVDYLSKPIDPHQVRAKVAVFVELFRQRKEIERQAHRLRDVELVEQRLLRERAEQAQRDCEALYQSTFEQAPVGIGHARPDGHWIQANTRLCEILGCSCDEIVGRSVGEIAADGNAGTLESALSQLGTGAATSYSGEHLLSSPREGKTWGLVTISALRNWTGQVANLIVVVDDTTGRKEAETERLHLIQKLERSIRARDEFLTIAAHELNTPLTPLRLQTASLLRGGGKALEDEGHPSPRLLRRLRRIDAAAARLENLVGGLLDLSRLSVGELVLHREEVDLKGLVESVASRISAEMCQGSEISVFAPERSVGRWDRLRLEQVITNLLVNAVNFGRRRPIEVAVSKDGDRVRLTVRDRGIGVPPADQGRIFERFERLTPLRHSGGFGVGLWIVREIVEAHGGHVTVASRPGEGSVFAVELPAWPTHDRAEDSTTPTTSTQQEVHP